MSKMRNSADPDQIIKISTMKICLSVSSPNLDSPVDPRFGRAPYFLITDEKGEKTETINNPGMEAIGGAGITAAQAVASSGAEVVISGNLGPRAFDVLHSSGIKIFVGALGLSAREALAKYEQGELEEISQPTGPSHFGLGQRFGAGGQRAGGQRAGGQGGFGGGRRLSRR